MKRPLAVLLMLALPAAARAADDPALARARRILSETPLIDGHNDLPWEIRGYEKAPFDVAAYDLRARTPGQTDLARLAEGKVGGQFWSVYVPGEPRKEGYARLQLEQIDIARQVIARYPERLAMALTADDVMREFRRGRGRRARPRGCARSGGRGRPRGRRRWSATSRSSTRRTRCGVPCAPTRPR